jgi:hypothetical protein
MMNIILMSQPAGQEANPLMSMLPLLLIVVVLCRLVLKTTLISLTGAAREHININQH